MAIAAPIAEEVRDPEAVTEQAIESTTALDRPLWRAKEILGEYRHRGFPYEAIVDFFIQNIASGENNEETIARLHAWGKTWDIDWVNAFTYDAENKTVHYAGSGADDRDSEGKLIVPQAEPAKHVSLTREEYNKVAEKHETLIRYLLRQEGLPEVAVEKYINENFHLLPMDIEKYYRLADFCETWGMPGYARVVVLFVETIVYGTANTEAENTPDVATEETTTATPRYPPFFFAQEILDMFLYKGVPLEAIVDFFSRGIDLSKENAETFYRWQEWGTKWNIDWVTSVTYDTNTNTIHNPNGDWDARDSEGKLVLPQAEPAKRVSLSKEEYNAVAVKNEALIRRLLNQQGLPEEAVEEYTSAGFHLLPMDMNKYLRLTDFCENWGVKSGATVVFAYVDTIIYGTANAEAEASRAPDTTTIPEATTTLFA